MKICSKCKTPKEDSEFSARSDFPHRLQSHCKPCKLDTQRAYNARNPGAAKKAVKEWVLRNPEKAAEMYRRNARKYRAKNLSAARDKVRVWQSKNRAHSQKYSKEYRRLNPESVRKANQDWRRRNPEKAHESFRNWAKNNPMKAEDTRLRKFGLTAKKWAAILASQSGGCAICKEAASIGKRRLAVDHDHGSGKVRGLLCARCNTALGLLRDSANLVQVAADYLKKHS